MLRAVRNVGDAGDRVLRVLMNLGHPRIHKDRAALLLDLIGGNIPQLAGAELRITEFLDQRSLDFSVLLVEDFTEDVFDDGRD